MKHGVRLVGIMSVLILVGIAVAFLLRHGGKPQDPVDSEPWRRILAFDVTDVSREHRGDVGNGTIVIATYARPIGWDVGVYAYPVAEASDNLLYSGTGEHGSKPWQSFAWSKREQFYPDVRIIDYGSPPQKLKIVLKDCQTAKREDFVVFTAGRIEVYHR